MTRDKVEIACAAIDAYSRGEHDAALALFDPDISWEAAQDLVPDARSYRGHEGVREFWREWDDLFDGFHLEIEDAREIRDGRVLVVCRALGKGVGSGVPVQSPRFSQIFDFDGDLVVRVRLHGSRRAGLAAAEAD